MLSMFNVSFNVDHRFHYLYAYTHSDNMTTICTEHIVSVDIVVVGFFRLPFVRSNSIENVKENFK